MIRQGFNCETCGKWHQFSMYVFAHSRDVLKHKCDNCGAEHSIVMMHAKQTKKGKSGKSSAAGEEGAKK